MQYKVVYFLEKRLSFFVWKGKSIGLKSFK